MSPAPTSTRHKAKNCPQQVFVGMVNDEHELCFTRDLMHVTICAHTQPLSLSLCLSLSLSIRLSYSLFFFHVFFLLGTPPSLFVYHFLSAYFYLMNTFFHTFNINNHFRYYTLTFTLFTNISLSLSLSLSFSCSHSF